MRTGLRAVTITSAAVGGSRFGAIGSPASIPAVRRIRRMKPTPAVRRRAKQVLAALAELYPDAHCALDHRTPIQLLVATILSAQCTDARVNLVTPALFARYRTVRDFADADQRELERLIASTGFFRNKARNIIACCQAILDRHGGEVPNSLD